MAILTDANMYDKSGKRHYASYYSGTDARIYFGDKWVDEIVEIEWTMQEQLAPIYGFASYTWDKVARGTRYVQGSFVVNFKEVGYLQTILNGLSSDMKGDEPFNLENFTEYNLGAQNERSGNYSLGQSVEMVISNFDNLKESYEEAFWGTDTDQASFVSARRDDSFFYGTAANANNKELRDHGFNIVMTFGRTADQGRGRASGSTVQTIVGVQLTGVSQRIDPSGNPIAEVYSFLAKDISGNAAEKY